MRLRTDKKYKQFSDTFMDNQLVHIRFHEMYKEKLFNDLGTGLSDKDKNGLNLESF